MKLRKGDKVKIIAGKDSGKIGTVLKVLPKTDRILVEGINIVKKNVKPGAVSKDGGIISVERTIHSSNAMFYEDKSARGVRLSSKIIDGKNYRVSKVSEEVVDKK